MDEDVDPLQRAIKAIGNSSKEELVRAATKAFFTNPEAYDQVREFAAQSGYYLIIRPQRDFYEPHTFNFGLVVTDKQEEIYFGCKQGWDFPSTIEDWWSEGQDRAMMKSFLFGLFADMAKGRLEDKEKNRCAYERAFALIDQIVTQRGSLTLGERMQIEKRHLPERQMLDVPLYARQTAQSAIQRLRNRYPEALPQGEASQIEDILAIDL